MTRKEISERALRRAQLEAQERHIRIENKRVVKLEAEFVAGYIGEIEGYLASAANGPSSSGVASA
jgi:hypothetical protein